MVDDTDWEKVGEKVKWAIIVARGNDIASTETKWDGEGGIGLEKAGGRETGCVEGHGESAEEESGESCGVNASKACWVSWVGRFCQIAMEGSLHGEHDEKVGAGLIEGAGGGPNIAEIDL